jgi:poly(hydroxyalkanoate) granule-associated protein
MERMAMTEKVSLIDVTEEVEEPKPLIEMVRRLLLASVGAVAVAQEELEAFVDRLVERGDLADKDARALLRDVRERRKQQLEETRQEARAAQEQRLDALLRRVNIPTKTDIAKLSERIEHLSKQVDDLLESSGE